MKRCCRCREDKVLSAFAKSSDNKDGLQHMCRTCSGEAHKAWREKNKEHWLIYHRERSRSPAGAASRKKHYYKNHEKSLIYHRNLRLIQKYGITLEQKATMLLEQENRCAICKREFSDLLRSNVDHCHQTKKNRELLCDPCNIAIGNFQENIKVLEAAIAYLQKHNPDQ